MKIVQFSIALHFCIQSLHLLHFKIKVTCICIPKIIFMLSAQISLIYQFPKSNVLSFEFRMRGTLKESTSCLLIRLSPLVLVPIGMFRRTQSPCFYLSQDSKSSFLPFIGLKVLAFTFRRTQSPFFYLSQDSKSSLLSFTGLKVLAFIFHRTQSPRFYL